MIKDSKRGGLPSLRLFHRLYEGPEIDAAKAQMQQEQADEDVLKPFLKKKQLTLFTHSLSPYCMAAKLILDRKRIPYREVGVEYTESFEEIRQAL